MSLSQKQATEELPQPLVVFAGQRWSVLFAMVSMDAVQLFRHEMGLSLPELVRWNEWLREQMVRFAKPTDGGASMFVPTTLQQMEAVFGTSATAALIEWGRSVFVLNPKDYAALMRWRSALDELAQSKLAWTRAWTGSAADAALHAFAGARNMTEMKAAVTEHHRNGVSSWDLAVCALRGWWPCDAADHHYSVARKILETAEHQRFLSFLREHAAALDEAGRDNLRERAMAVAPATVNEPALMPLHWLVPLAEST
ncbi:MAG TPA: hypothetical protein ENK23_08500, partial [Sorangium sp.]|nr:hypothetical protein [Sorangium sp.]